ncbi:protein white-like [Oppia nitens]|uniref:protein white-like n=1 Tax=Oppia nitens TaxID=1686743 RepID=UPI0023DCDE9A|nr:protein white-like [Oppia nitens]
MNDSESLPLIYDLNLMAINDLSDDYDFDVSNRQQLVLSSDSPAYGSLNDFDITGPVSISWHNINVFNKTSNGKQLPLLHRFKKPSVHILKNVSGEAKSGQLMAIMGSSGAGKTTLMNALAQRNVSDVSLEGTVRLNGQAIDKHGIRAVSAYVQQDDLFISTLTVKEHLWFQSKLRMDPSLNRRERKARVDKILLDLGLNKCANTKIGSPEREKGISGGERKRLSFASELLTDPSIMFCDEPTSGLDSYMALNVVEVLRDMAANGKTIICTIHQPSSEVFFLFNHLLLMADGKVAYLGKAGEAMEFFSSLGYSCPNNYNPSDFYIKQLAVVPGSEDESKEHINFICDRYRDSWYANQYMPGTGRADSAMYTDSSSSQGTNPFSSTVSNNNNSFKSNGRVYRSGWCTQFWVLLYRSILTTYRDPIIFKLILVTLFIVIVMGLIYLHLELNQKGIRNINGALWMLLMYLNLQSLFGTVNTFCKEVPIFHREHSNNVYRVSPYFLTKMLAELPIYVIIPLMFVSIFYFMVGLNNNLYRFVTCVCICLLAANIACGFGYLMALITHNITAALMLSAPLLIPLMIFGGLFNNIDTGYKPMGWRRQY